MDNKLYDKAGMEPELPIPISSITNRYFIFSVDAVTFLRREYNICGVLVGTLPQVPQQNVFLGLPLELMPEEARLLVEKGVAYIIDDARDHSQGIKNLREEDKRRYIHNLEQIGSQATTLLSSKKAERREVALQKQKSKEGKSSKRSTEAGGEIQPPPSQTDPDSDVEGDGLLFASSYPNLEHQATSSKTSATGGEQILEITPATSHGLLERAHVPDPQVLPEVPPSYPLFAYLHSQGYFLSPGLRFGCQYMAYPGDPLRFHSHFLVTSTEWDEEFDLMDLVAGGRLGTGVKKGYLIGGADARNLTGNFDQSVRAFSLEWAGM